MRFIILLLLPILSFAQSRIEINGKTNVNKFTCTNNNPIITQYYNTAQDGAIPATIKLNVKDFDCNNKRMTKDFREMLDFEKHPLITITNHEFNWIKTNTYQSNSEVEMSGRKKTYSINLRNVSGGWNLRKIISLSDFNLEPPRVLGGLIYVKDDVLIDIYIEN